MDQSTQTYLTERETRRRRLTTAQIPFVAGPLAALGYRFGIGFPLILAAMFVAFVLAVRLVMFATELGVRRRAAGSGASWPARLPAQYARRFGVHVPAEWDDTAELFGRIHQRSGCWEWVASPQQSRVCGGIEPVALGSDPAPSVRPIWGLFDIGILTLTNDGETVPLWIRRPRDLRDHLGTPVGVHTRLRKRLA